jgi:phosphotransferase system enzyme I (PtsI)
MITSLEELYKIKEVISEAKKELRDEGYLYHDVELGIMVETPAAAVISDLLAEEVDFLSIGTNDLTQYTLAVDRQNSKVDDFCNTHHIAILRLIKTVIDNGHKKGCWVGICGELAADLSLTEEFIEMGIDELSVSPLCILSVRERICMADTNII